MPSARVYIWYPGGLDKGHAAMLIGDDEAVVDNYVSWWPTGIRQYLPIRARRDLERTLATDTLVYNREPDRVYDLSELDVPRMLQKWRDIRGIDRPNVDTHYELFTRNCSLTVKSVLEAGLPPDAPALHALDWTPKDIALWCSRYLAVYPAPDGEVARIKRNTESKWKSPFYALVRMR